MVFSTNRLIIVIHKPDTILTFETSTLLALVHYEESTIALPLHSFQEQCQNLFIHQ